MSYFDDILNVYAYMFSKSEKNMEKSKKIAEDIEELEKSYGDILEDAENLNASFDKELESLMSFAEDLGIDVSDIVTEEPIKKIPEKEKTDGFKFEKIKLPDDFDFQKDFQRLVEEAHNAGFTNVRPEDLLSEAEMEQARAFSEKIDADFAVATGLKPKDIPVILIAVVMRMFGFFVLQRIQITVDNGDLIENGGLLERSYNSEENTQVPQNGKNGNSVMGDIDATKGVDIGGMLRDMNASGVAISSIGKTMGLFGMDFSPIRILDSETILKFDKPFELQHTDKFTKNDIMAYNKFLGWIMGVANLLTNTVTTFNVKSYSVNRIDPLRKGFAENEISTVNMIRQVLKNASYCKTSVVAAVIQEALTLGFGSAQPSQVRELFSRSVCIENKTSLFMEKAANWLRKYNSQLAANIGGVAMITLINTVVSAVHAMLYDDKADGSIDTYSVRTGKIIMYSGVIATIANSMPAVATENFSELDFAGIVTTCISLFQSTKFWIDVKANFVYGEYKAVLDEEMRKIDKYFE